eukprot:Awhi_evm1s15620
MCEVTKFSGALARASAESLKFQTAILLLLMCRALLFRLRVIWRGKVACYLPLDYTVEGHICVGFVYLVLSVVHVCSHIANVVKLTKITPEQNDLLLSTTDWTFKTAPSASSLLFETVFGITGLIMVALMIIAYIGIPYRRLNHKVFWSTHNLLILVVFLTIFHGAKHLLGAWTAPIYIGIPFSLYICDKLYILIMNEWGGYKGHHRIRIISTRFVGDNQNIVHLVASKPKTGFTYIPGSYAFLKVPSISKIEWHPFTIASTPKDRNICFYIKNSGDWTQKLIEKLKAKTFEMYSTDRLSKVALGAMDYDENNKNIESENVFDVINICNQKGVTYHYGRADGEITDEDE